MPFDYDAVKDIIRCPKTLTELVPHHGQLVNCSAAEPLAYPILDGFPILVPDRSTPLEREVWVEAMRSAGRDAVTGEPEKNR